MNEYDAIEKLAEKANECRDCAVRAMALATDTPYNKVLELSYKFGRKPRGKTYRPTLSKILKSLGVKTTKVTEKFHSKTVLTLGREMANVKGRYLVWTSGHLLCIKDGKVCDWTEGTRHRIRVIKQLTTTISKDNDE